VRLPVRLLLRAAAAAAAAMDAASTWGKEMRTKLNFLGNKLQRGDIKSYKMENKDLLDDDDAFVEAESQAVLHAQWVSLSTARPKWKKNSLIQVETIIEVESEDEVERAPDHGGKEHDEEAFVSDHDEQAEETVIEHDEEAFVSDMELRHSAWGCPLNKVVMEGNKIDWSSCEVYALCNEEAEEKAPYTHVLHRASGVKVQPPMQTIDKATLFVRSPYTKNSYQ
jgi:hypothetical protein